MRYHLLLLVILAVPFRAFAFCGFYVGKADSKLYNKSSKVIFVRHDNKSVISMMNDYQGDLKEFAMVIPVPEVLKEGQINVGEQKLFDRIDSFTAPRLVEYFDSDPCRPRFAESRVGSFLASDSVVQKRGLKKSYGVTVEAEYTVGEYDIVLLSAKQSDGLEDWLRDNKYNIPKGAKAALRPYILQGMKFFVAKVNLEKQLKTGLSYLRPLQIAFESPRFMLPIRLGMLNAKGTQELLIYLISKDGRVETSNYTTKKIPSDIDLPLYIKKEFGDFYKAMFNEQVRKEGMKTVFTEYFWNLGWCDPCAAEPLTPSELRKLGVFWLKGGGSNGGMMRRRPGGVPAMVTRLHLRYNGETFPEDLMFQETKDKRNFQGRYILRHPWKGDSQCEAVAEYYEAKYESQENAAKNLARLTAWDVNDIRSKVDFVSTEKSEDDGEWWSDLW